MSSPACISGPEHDLQVNPKAPSRPSVKRKLVSVGFQALRATGLLGVAADSTRRTKSLLILAYHGLACNGEELWRPDLYLRPDQFRGRLQILREMKAAVLPLSEALLRLQEGTLPPRSVTITFDDGFQDLLTAGVPALEEFGYPATLYLTTHYSGYRRPVISLILDYLLWRVDSPDLSLPEYGLAGRTPIHNYVLRQQAVRKIREWMDAKHMGTIAKDEAVQGIAAQLGIDYREIVRRKVAQILDPESVRAVAKAGVNIQLHTHRHRTSLDRTLFVREIVDNRNWITELTGKVPEHFCYPSGVYRPDFFTWLKECNVKSATTCSKGLANQSSAMMQLPRLLDDSGMDPQRFAGAVAGIIL